METKSQSPKDKFTVIVQKNIEERNIPIIYNVYGQIDSPKKSYSSMPQLDYIIKHGLGLA